MLPAEGTDVHVSRCGSISSWEKKLFKNINTSKSSVLREGVKGTTSSSQQSTVGEQEGRVWCCLLVEESPLLQ